MQQQMILQQEMMRENAQFQEFMKNQQHQFLTTIKIKDIAMERMIEDSKKKDLETKELLSPELSPNFC